MAKIDVLTTALVRADMQILLGHRHRGVTERLLGWAVLTDYYRLLQLESNSLNSYYFGCIWFVGIAHTAFSTFCWTKIYSLHQYLSMN